MRWPTVAIGFIVPALLTSMVASCSDDDTEPRDVAAVCALNEEFADLNERTIPDIEPGVAYHDAAALEENFVEGVRLMREMVEAAP